MYPPRSTNVLTWGPWAPRIQESSTSHIVCVLFFFWGIRHTVYCYYYFERFYLFKKECMCTQGAEGEGQADSPPSTEPNPTTPRSRRGPKSRVGRRTDGAPQAPPFWVLQRGGVPQLSRFSVCDPRRLQSDSAASARRPHAHL